MIQESLSKNALQTADDSILRQQLGRISESAFGEKPEETFWAVNALRHVMGSFKKFGVGEGMTQAKADEMRRRYGPPVIL